MKTLGYSIALDVFQQEESDPDSWSAGAIALAWYDATGRDFEELQCMVRADQLWARVDGSKEMAIFQMIWTYSQDFFE